MTKLGAECRRWTQEERDYIDDKWGLVSIRLIATHLNRSYKAVQRYAEKNNLGGSCFNDFLYTVGDVAKKLNVDNTTVLAYIEKGQLKAKPRKFEKNNRFIYVIEPEDFEEFKKTYKKKNYNVWTILQENKLKALAQEGKSDREIAEILGKTKSSVSNKRRRLLKEN